MDRETVRSKPLRGTIRVPGDKSISHRSVMLGAISEGETRVRGFLKSADCLATIDCFRKLGIRIDETAGSPSFGDTEEDIPDLIIHGKGLRGLSAPSGVVLNAMNSGTTVRLLSGILAGQAFQSEITGDSSLQKRPMMRIMRPLSEMGIRVESAENPGCVPIRIFGGTPEAIHYESRIASAQVKSCVLLAGLFASAPTFYTEPYLSRNHTELMLQTFGGNLKVRKKAGGDGVTTILYPGTLLHGQTVTVPGDISSAAYFLAAGLLVPGSEITLTGVGINETRDGILRVIRSMGGNISLSNIRMEGREPLADITVRYSRLHATEIGGALIPTLIDEIPVIAVMAACAEGVTVIRDAAELKVKESNRLSAVTTCLRAMGIIVDETDDGMKIRGGRLKGGAVLDPNGDHRMAMAFSIAGLLTDRPTVIRHAECVDVSYPDFYEDLQSLQ
jgi:3-phosphoshikimate 1-carboxyvinyltransferase